MVSPSELCAPISVAFEPLEAEISLLALAYYTLDMAEGNDVPAAVQQAQALDSFTRSAEEAFKEVSAKDLTNATHPGVPLAGAFAEHGQLARKLWSSLDGGGDVDLAGRDAANLQFALAHWTMVGATRANRALTEEKSHKSTTSEDITAASGLARTLYERLHEQIKTDQMPVAESKAIPAPSSD